MEGYAYLSVLSVLVAENMVLSFFVILEIVGEVVFCIFSLVGSVDYNFKVSAVFSKLLAVYGDRNIFDCLCLGFAVAVFVRYKSAEVIYAVLCKGELSELAGGVCLVKVAVFVGKLYGLDRCLVFTHCVLDFNCYIL